MPDWTKDDKLVRVVATLLEGMFRYRPQMSAEWIVENRSHTKPPYIALRARKVHAPRTSYHLPAMKIEAIRKRREPAFDMVKFGDAAERLGIGYAWMDGWNGRFTQKEAEARAAGQFTQPYLVERVSDKAIEGAKKLIAQAMIEAEYD